MPILISYDVIVPTHKAPTQNLSNNKFQNNFESSLSNVSLLSRCWKIPQFDFGYLSGQSLDLFSIFEPGQKN